MTVNNENTFTMADAIVKELKREGVEVAFGIVSIHNMPIYDAILRDGSIHLVGARGESGAVNMADGYARATGKIGVVITSTGAGAGNTAGSLTEAWNRGVPLLHLSGDVAFPHLGTGKRYIHECKDQLQMMEGASKKAYHVKNPEQISSLMRHAIAEAKALPSGPVTINMPIDFQSVIVPDTTFIDATPEVSKEALKPVHIPEEVVSEIAAAKRPTIWAGGGVLEANAMEELTQFAEKIGAAVISGQSGKGAIREDHPQWIGHFATMPPTKELFEKSDLFISIGTKLRGNETGNWTLPLSENHIKIDLDINAFNLSYPVKYGIVGDAKQVLKQLVEELDKKDVKADSAYIEEVENTRNKLRDNLRAAVHPYDKFVDVMREKAPEDAIFVRDITVPASLWGSRLFNIYQPNTNIYASGGGIGQGLPTAIGAQVGARDKVVMLMVGDGGFMLNVGELATAAQEELPMIVLLFDDKGYGVLRGIQDDVYNRRVGVELFTPDFVTLGESMGFESVRIKDAEEFAEELEKAIASKKPSMIVVDMNAVGPMASRGATAPDLVNNYIPKKRFED